MFKGFDPIYNSESKVLILGSFPSVKSREVGFYYGNKQNKFWKVLSKIFNEEIGQDKIFKTNFLIKHCIALYDIVAESNLIGSADEKLKKSKIKISDITNLLPPNTNVCKILCNGKTAFELLKKSSVRYNVPIIYLPSTSPANTNFDFKVWEQELTFLKI